MQELVDQEDVRELLDHLETGLPNRAHFLHRRLEIHECFPRSAELRDHWPRAGTAPGDAVIFRIAEHLRHRVSPVTGGTHRVAFAGWFKSSPSFRSVVAGGSWNAAEGR